MRVNNLVSILTNGGTNRWYNSVSDKGSRVYPPTHLDILVIFLKEKIMRAARNKKERVLNSNAVKGPHSIFNFLSQNTKSSDDSSRIVKKKRLLIEGLACPLLPRHVDH